MAASAETPDMHEGAVALRFIQQRVVLAGDSGWSDTILL